MAIPRKYLVSLEDTPYYHCTGRCVRRAFLYGDDYYSGRNYNHRKSWVIERLKLLTEVFSIKVCAYAVLSNHYHLVLYIDQARSNTWTDKEVLQRWRRLFPNASTLKRKITMYRSRLINISWFMQCLNEYIARRANKEDDCKGRFWEGRFKSQALLDEGALLACMTYVDLNPIRARISYTPEESDFTSIYERIKDHLERSRDSSKQHSSSKDPSKEEPPAIAEKQKCFLESGLMQFQPEPLTDKTHSIVKWKERGAIPITWEEYLELVDWSGREIVKGKQGAIPLNLLPIMERLNLQEKSWLSMIEKFKLHFFLAIGDANNLTSFFHNKGIHKIKGSRTSKKFYKAV